MRKLWLKLAAMETANFCGAKLAVIAAGQVLTLQRDNKPGLPYPGLWDLPGGGREPGETPLDCALRETLEETGLRVPESAITWDRVYANPRPDRWPTWFFVAEPGWLALPHVRLGDEGQDLRWMPVETFLEMDGAITHLQSRLRDYFAEKEAQAWRNSRAG